MHGDAGREWLLSGLPERIRHLEGRLSVEASGPFPNLTYNYVAPAVRKDGTNVVLKLGFPGSGELTREAVALKAFDGRGMVKLLESEPDALLLERVMPGDSLVRETDDVEATRILAETLVRTRTPAPADHNFPHVRDWTGVFERLGERQGGETGQVPGGLITEAEALVAELRDTAGEEYLLHGDLHHDNVLRNANGGWTVIDPKGVVGDAAYEAAAMMYHPPGFASRPNLRALLERRLDIVCDVAGLERGRVLAWARVQAVLSAVWSVEDHGHVPEDHLTVAEHLRAMRPRSPNDANG